MVVHESRHVSIGGSVVEFSPATREARVRFPDVVIFSFRKLIHSSIGSLTRLQQLNLNRNQLHRLPPTIGYCRRLLMLELRSNMLRSLPEEIGNCLKLKYLDVADNEITVFPTYLPECK